ncbi:MAG: M20 family metallopeptidase [Pseudomonadota bacterium]
MDDALATAVADREPSMFSLLAELVGIHSGSHHKAGVDRVGARIRAHLSRLPVTITAAAQCDMGDHLVVRTAAVGNHPRQVLMVGHMDTVFPVGTEFTDYREDGRCCYGPGIIDMKGGLVAGIFALEALNDAGLLADIPITFIFNSDEEIGSHSSRPLIRAEAAKSRFAFVMECGGMTGSIVTGRKGNRSFRLECFGRAGHAAAAGPDKASAILALAHHTLTLEALNDPARGISVNVGQITGGIGPNTVAEKAAARIDTRFTDPDDEARLLAVIEKTVAATAVTGVHCRLETVSRRPPMPPTDGNRRLFQLVAAVADELGMPVTEEFRFGVSDANIIAAEGVPVLDGLGPLGENDHSDREYMLRDSLPRRALLLAHSLVRCWKAPGSI